MGKAKETVETKELAVVEKARALVVKTDADYEAGGKIRAELKALEKEVKSSFRPIIEQAKAAHQEALAQEKKHLAPIRAAVSVLDSAMLAYSAEKRRQAEEAAEKERARLEKLAAKAEKAGREDRAEVYEGKAAAVVAAPVVTKTEFSATRSIPDTEKIEAEVEAKFPRKPLDIGIPGVEAYYEASFRVVDAKAVPKEWRREIMAGRA